MAVTLDRAFLKDMMPELIGFIQGRHEMGPEVEKELFHNKEYDPQVNLTHTRQYYMIAGPYFIKYEMDHQIRDVELKLIGRRLNEVVVFENFQEYEADRVRNMSASKSQTGLNFN